jgi:hypothetical protein
MEEGSFRLELNIKKKYFFLLKQNIFFLRNLFYSKDLMVFLLNIKSFFNLTRS